MPEAFSEQVKALGLRVDDAEAAALRAMLAELDELYRLVAAADRVPSEERVLEMRLARELGEHGVERVGVAVDVVERQDVHAAILGRMDVLGKGGVSAGRAACP